MVKWGYIDKTGVFVIPPHFDNLCGRYSEGLADVMVDDKCGFIDKTGDFLIPPQFEWVHPFVHGIAAVSIEEKYGYIDKSGAIVIPPMFEEVDEFSEGLAYAKTATQEGYIDPTGAWALITPPHYYCGHPFCDGLTRADLCEDNELNEDGCTEECNCLCEGYIDKTGAIAIPPQFREVDDFSEGLAHVETEHGEHVFIDTKGDVALKFDFEYESRHPYFSEGLVAVKVGGKYGYADKTGKIAIAPQFDEVYRFTEELAGARIGSRWGFIDKTGEWVIEPKPWHPFGFFEGLAAVAVQDYNMEYVYP